MRTKKANPNLIEETNVNVSDPNKTSGTSPPGGYPLWEEELQVLIATQGMPDSWEEWKDLLPRGDAALKQGDSTQARRHYAEACRALWVDTVENTLAQSHHHPAMLKVLLHFADRLDTLGAVELVLDVHVRLACVVEGLINEYEGWARARPGFDHERRMRVLQLAEPLSRAASTKAPQRFPHPSELSPQCVELRRHAQRMCAAFDVEHAEGRTLDALRKFPHPSKR